MPAFSPQSANTRRGVAWTLVVLAVVCLVTSGGCSSVRMIRSRLPSPGREFLQSGVSRVFPRPSQFTEQTEVGLRTLNLDRLAVNDPPEAIRQLEERLQESWRLEMVGMVAEVAFEGAKRYRNAPKRSETLYFQAVSYAYMYLFDKRLEVVRNPYDPLFTNMCRIYNKSTEALLRATSRHGVFSLNHTGAQTLAIGDLPQTFDRRMFSDDWSFEDFVDFRFASDFDVTGFKNRYRHYGIGVPIVARTCPAYKKRDRCRYCMDDLCVSLTVFLRLDPGHAPVFEFYDPTRYSRVKMESHFIPMEIDYTTPLAYTLSLANERETYDGKVGLLRPDKLLEKTPDGTREIKGLYMVQPYDPNKIPVVLVHGLLSSPIVWMEMYNTLNSVEDIRSRYQFWFYFYPNGQPFWVSASQFRDDLAEVRRQLDPRREQVGLDQMVLVGHSMGGLMALLQTLDSGDTVWSRISQTAPEALPGSDPARSEVPRWFHFEANPSISCVISMATPFHGSALANHAMRNLTGTFSRRAAYVETNLDQFLRENADVVADPTLLRHETSVDSLQKESPIWDAMMSCDPAPWTTYYNIIGTVPVKLGQTRNSDGVVSVGSATLPWADSEIRVKAEHSAVPSNPQAILEVAQILIRLTETTRAPKLSDGL